MKKELENKLDVLARQFFGHNTKPEKDDKWTPKFNLKKPPGLVGEVAEYINSQCRFQLENLSVLAALVAVGNIGGLNHGVDDNPRLSFNLLGFGVAGSGVGKESVIQAFNDLHVEAGISGAVHGSIKSEQEIIRNLIRNQSALYNIDEIGIFLRKLNMSHKSGGASYLQGVIGTIMSVYSKASGNLLLSGDVKDEVKKELSRELAALNKMLDSGDAMPSTESRIEVIKQSLTSIDKGLERPFLSIIGFSTPSTFNESVSFEQVTSGFIGRAIIVNEPDTNPRPKPGFEYSDMPEALKIKISGLCATGEYNAFDTRVESRGERRIIRTTPEARQALENASEWIFNEADKHVENTGFEAVVRRGNEGIEKISAILGMGDGERTLEHVEWAFEYIRRDIEYKTLLAHSNVEEKLDPIKSTAAKILCELTDGGITIGRLVNRYRTQKVTKRMVEEAIDRLEKKGKIYCEDTKHKYNGKTYRTIFKRS